MSDLLQRLIDRTREPLSAVRPILPSIYTPADKNESDGGVISQANFAPESTAQSSPAPIEQSDKHGSGEASPPVAVESIETRANPAAPAPPRGETGAPPRPPAPRPLSRPPPDLKSTLQRTEAGILPAPATRNPLTPAEAISPRPPETGTISNADEKRTGKATGPLYTSITKTVMPPGLGSRNPLLANANKAAAMMRKIAPLPADAAPVTPAENKTASPAFEIGRSKTEISTTKEAIPPSQGQPGEARKASATISPSLDPAPASSRETKDADIGTPINREAFSARSAGHNSKKSFENDGRAPPVEVHVSIGHIEVKSAQPNAPVPRRTPPRPRVTLDEFLKHPHYGGPR
jgi:hypothetical protein